MIASSRNAASIEDLASARGAKLTLRFRVRMGCMPEIANVLHRGTLAAIVGSSVFERGQQVFASGRKPGSPRGGRQIA